MFRAASVTRSPGQDQHGRFCRACGYNLRASSQRCGECGRAFDAADPGSFSRRPPRGVLCWVRRAGCVSLALLVAAGAALLWLRHGWHDEQRHLAVLRQHLGHGPGQVTVTSEPLNPWLRRRLPDRVGVYLERVIDVQLYSTAATDEDLKAVKAFTHLRGLMVQGPAITDAGLAELKALTRLQELDITCRQVTDAGLANLAGMRRMQDLMIRGGRITDAGLEHLHGMPELRRLIVCMNDVSREGLLRWMRRHPGVQVIDGPGGPIRAGG